jgi:hypothetical protein
MSNVPDAIEGLAVVNYVNGVDLQKLLNVLRSRGFHLVMLKGNQVRDKGTFLKAASEQVFDGISTPNWSAFEDLWRNTALSLAGPYNALVWTDVHQMLEGGLSDLIVAVDIATSVSRELYAGNRVLVTFLVGDGENFPLLNLR